MLILYKFPYNDLILTIFFQAKKKQVSYKESDSEGEEDDEVIFRPNRKNGRASKRQKTVVESDEEEFKEAADDAGYSDDGKF